MAEKMEFAIERRGRPRFGIVVPLTVLAGKREIPGFTRDLSNQGVYFYLDLDEEAQISGDIDFLINLPPEITNSTCCMIRAQGRVVRADKRTPGQLAGIAATILHSSMDQGR